MKFSLKHLTIAAFLIAGAALPTQAATLGNGGWNYTVDSFDDSIEGNQIGRTNYEIYSMAYKEVGNQLVFGINTNLPLQGIFKNSPHVDDGHIGWGDLILNFTGASLDAANGSIYGLRFADNNDSGVPQIGLYSNVVVTSVASQNGLLLPSLSAYNAYVSSHLRTPSNGDLSASDPYFNQSQTVANVIQSGNLIGAVTILTAAELQDLDFGSVGAFGTHTFGFSVDKSLLPIGNFLAHLAPDCTNDVIAILGRNKEEEPSPKPVPEGSAVMGLIALGSFIFRRSLVSQFQAAQAR